MKLAYVQRILPGVHRAVIVVTLIAVGAAMFIAPIVGASDENMYVSCAQLTSQEPAAKRHPNNCILSAAGVHRHSGVLVLLDFRQISWRQWGSATAHAVAVSVNASAHTRTKVRFAVSGRQTCSGLAYYARIVLEGPKRLYQRPLSFELGCGS